MNIGLDREGSRVSPQRGTAFTVWVNLPNGAASLAFEEVMMFSGEPAHVTCVSAWHPCQLLLFGSCVRISESI